MPYGKRKRSTRRTFKRKYTRSYKRGAATASRAYRLAKSLSRRVAGEVCKFETTPDMYGSTNLTASQNASMSPVNYSYVVNSNRPLLTITSGTPWVMPLNWIYEPAFIHTVTATENELRYNNNALVSTATGLQYKNPVYYKMQNSDIAESSQLQYRLKYIYINAIFRAAANSAGSVRFVVVKDKQPSDQGATWFNEGNLQRSVFNSNNINAQLNPHSVSRFKIISDRTIQFSTIQPYKVYKFLSKKSYTTRNNQATINPSFDLKKNIPDSGIPGTTVVGPYPLTQTGNVPVQKNAYYLMICSDGLDFTYDSDGATDASQFKLFNRVAYYNN